MSKIIRLSEYINNRVDEAVNAIVSECVAANSLDTARHVESLRNRIKARVEYRIVFDVYRRRQLYDIVAWKKPPKTRGT